MTKDPSPLLGYNNNIRHNNRVFHVQTEDSGVRHPHIITHLFMDGGRILKSKKTNYTEYVGQEKMADVVRQIMKEQHKGMLVALRAGEFDHLLDAATSKAPPPPPSAGAAASPRGDSSAAAHAPTVREMQGSPAAGPPTRSAPSSARVKTAAKGAPSPRPPETTLPDEPPVTSRNSHPPAAATEHVLTLDIDALPRGARQAKAAPFTPSTDLPPPPANLLRPKELGVEGAYRTVAPPVPTRRPTSRPPSRTSDAPPGRDLRAEDKPAQTTHPPTHPKPPGPPPLPRAASGRSSRPPPLPTSRPSPSRPPPRPAPSRPPPSDPRYAPARPAAIFGQAQPKRGNSIFGEDLISDKSLDEVILGYLSEDASPDNKKK